MTEQTDEMFFPNARAAATSPDGDSADGDGVQAAIDTRPGELTEPQLEALLFVAERPLSRSEIAQLAGVSLEVVDTCIGDLTVTLGERGIRLVESGEHVELATAPEAGRLIARYVGADAPRLSSASLETLAIVAYRQPCTRATIERIRGVDSDYTLRTLMHRRLVAELGRSEAPGRPILFGTGFDFLERFGLTSVDDLPPLEPEIAERLFSAAVEEVDPPDQEPDGLHLGLPLGRDGAAESASSDESA
jgi:segregation and condensation protein B